MQNKNETEKKQTEEEGKNNKKEYSIASLRENRKKITLSLYSKVYLNLKEEISKKKTRNISLNELDDKEIEKLYLQLKKVYKKRTKKDNIEIFLFLLKTRIKDNFKSDLLHTEYNLNSLFTFVNPYISANIYNIGEIIYSYGDEAEYFYLILKGCVGQYKLVEYEEYLTSEDYYAYLWNKFSYFKKTMISGDEKEKCIYYTKEKEYTDIELIRKMSSINKETFPLFSFDDMEELNKIMIEIKIYITLVENRSLDINDTFTKFNIPLSYMNYDKLLKHNISPHYIIQNLSKRIKQREQFYMKYLAKSAEFKVKLLKYVKIELLKPYNYFGNFELIDTKPSRIDTIRCESDFTVLMTFNKKIYSKVINNIQKEKREKEINFLHNDFYFKRLNKYFFESKMFTKYKIDNFLKGHILVNQGEKLNKFIFVREGIIETSINNISLLELANRIKKLQEFIIVKTREFNADPKDIIDFDIFLNHKTNLEYELIEGILKQKQSFVLSRTEKGCFGDYEYCFNTPSFVTKTIISKNGKIYFYEYEYFKKINEKIRTFNEYLRDISFSKLKSILKRMITIYNSYFKFNIKQIETRIMENENENNLKKMNTSNSIKIEGDIFLNTSQQKNFSSPIILFKKNTRNIFNFINSKNENNNSRDSLEKYNSVKRSRNMYALSNDSKKIEKFGQTACSQINAFQSDKYNKTFQNKLINLKKNQQKDLKKNLNSFSTDNSFNKKKLLTIIKKNKYIKNLLKEIKKKYKNLKTEPTHKRGLFNVFLPPLLSQESNKDNNDQNDISNSNDDENVKINYHFFKNYASITNSINNASLGHKDKDNLNNNNLKLSNLGEKKFNDLTRKAKSINIKNAQINIIKNRNKKFKLLLQKKSEEDSFYEGDFF